MPGRIRDEDIAAVREKSPIDDVIGEHVQLRNAGGGNLKGLCPFHDEKSPSFNVTPSRGLYYCFGCQASGDVIGFVREMEHLSFSDAVERLAARAGIQLRYVDGGSGPSAAHRGQRQRLLDAHAEAARFYEQQLRGAEGETAREFLRQRGFDDVVAARYGCGYAPAAWDTLTRHLLANRFSAQELVLAGLARDGSRGGLVDRFHRRLLWPIRDIAGDVVGFGARRLFDDDRIEAKYLNTPETPIYKKSQLLYGVDLAKKDIARSHQAVIVEGYTDVMACHLSGVPTAVATCGTAFGSEHVSVVRRLLMDSDTFVGQVIFTFDGDAAGQKAAERAFADDQKFMAQTYVAVAAGGLDPCDLRLQRGEVAVRDLVASRIPLVEFMLRTTVGRFDLDTAEGRSAALDRSVPLVAQIKDRGLRDQYAVRLSGLVGFVGNPDAERDIVARVRGMVRSGEQRERAEVAPKPAVAPVVDEAVADVERETLKIALQLPAIAGPEFDSLEPDAFLVERYRALRVAISDVGGVAAGLSGPAWTDAVAARAGDDRLRRGVHALTVEPLRVNTDLEEQTRYASAMLARMHENVSARQIETLKSKLQRINPQERPEEYARLFGELIALEAYRRTLRERAIGGQ